MWKKKRIASMVLGVSVTLTSVMPAAPAYAVNNRQTQETETGRTSFKRVKNLSTPSDAEFEEELEDEFEEEEFEDEFEEDEFEDEEFDEEEFEDEEIVDKEEILSTPSDAEEMEEQKLEKPGSLKAPTATLSEAEQQTHLAVFTGEIPEVGGVEWDETVTADDFEKPYSTVTIKSV